MDDYREPYSLSDDIGGSVAGVMLDLLFFGVSFVIGLIGYLIVRVDILNSLLISTLPMILLKDQVWNWKMNLGIYIAIAFVIFVMEHTFSAVRLLCSIFGCFVVGLICYGIRIHDPLNVRIITMGIGFLIAAIMNRVNWQEFK